jgi:hypothetical protein
MRQLPDRRPPSFVSVRRLGEDEAIRQILTISTGLVVILSVVAYVLTV